MQSKLQIKLISDIEDIDTQRDELAKNNLGLFFHSSSRVRFLKEYLNVEDVSIGAFYNNKLVGYINILVKNGILGKVANSLPYYGSNGGVILDLSLDYTLQNQIKESILDFYLNFMEDNNIVLSCIITNPLYKDKDFYTNKLDKNIKFTDYRIGQFTQIPVIDKEDVIQMIHTKTRNMIRKAQKFGFKLYKSKKDQDIDFLYETHVENMLEIGGLHKNKEYFEKITKNSGYEWELWIAEKNGEKAAGMLIYKFGDVIEYVTPVIKHDFRNFQPLSLLIYEALIENVGKYKWWNWGGTWESQEGVYRFKKRWGTIDLNYYYNIICSDKIKEVFLNTTSGFLLRNYPFFYTVPFDLLKKDNNE